MIDFAIFAVTFVIFLLMLVFYLYPGSSRQTTIPGLDPSDSKEGNLPDILQAGGLHPFLCNLHKTHGPIASFWMGPKVIVSIASPELFEQHLQVFDKPEDLFSLFKPIMGEASILFTNGTEARKKRQYLDKLYSPESCNKLTEILQKLSDELVTKWDTVPDDQHIPLHQYMTALCMKVATNLTMGSYFQNNDNILEFSRNFEICWTELEARVAGSVPEPNSPREQRLQNAAKGLRTLIRRAADIEKLEKHILLNFFKESQSPEQEITDEILTVIFKHYSIAAALTWAIYFLATHSSVQEKVYKELKNVLDQDTFSPVSMTKLGYLRQVIDETLRISVVEPWTARCQDLDVEIGGHLIPKNTPVIHALGVVLCSDKHWVLPSTFNPERFSQDNEAQKGLAFQAFGFAGKRYCPGKELAYFEMMLFLSMLCSRFQFHLVSGQVVNPVYGIITKPEEEIWITITKHN